MSFISEPRLTKRNYKHLDDMSDEEEFKPKVKVSRRRISKHRDIGAKWSKKEDEKLIKLVNKHGTKYWSKIARYLGSRSPNHCLNRWEAYLKPASRKGTWSKEEDEILKEWVIKHGPTSWTDCAKLIRGRSGKQCRERWVNALDPNVKRGNWTKDEQEKIFDLMIKNLTSWSNISKSVVGRTENSIKNYFYSTIRRIQSNKVFQYFSDIKQNKEEIITDRELFIETYELEKLNHLGFTICIFLWENSDLNEKLSEFLLNVITDDKRRKNSKGYKKNSDKGGKKSMKRKRGFMRKKTSREDNPMNGINPFLPIFLYSQFKSINENSNISEPHYEKEAKAVEGFLKRIINQNPLIEKPTGFLPPSNKGTSNPPMKGFQVKEKIRDLPLKQSLIQQPNIGESDTQKNQSDLFNLMFKKETRPNEVKEQVRNSMNDFKPDKETLDAMVQFVSMMNLKDKKYSTTEGKRVRIKIPFCRQCRNGCKSHQEHEFHN